MEIIAACYTDIGRFKQINQDSLSVRIVNSPHGKIAFALICDGMGGLAKGEVASKEVITAFCNWFDTQFVEMVDNNSFSEELLKSGKMIFVRYPIHLNEASCRKLLAENQIERVVYYHSTEFYCEKRIKV